MHESEYKLKFKTKKQAVVHAKKFKRDTGQDLFPYERDGFWYLTSRSRQEWQEMNRHGSKRS